MVVPILDLSAWEHGLNVYVSLSPSVSTPLLLEAWEFHQGLSMHDPNL